MSLKGRVKALERSRASGCSECLGKRPVAVEYEDGPPTVPEFCRRCGREMTLIVHVTWEDSRPPGKTGPE